ncbi:uncharacterized protein M421DRAFT_1717 [Didymella exigua CBS 183.55]|uniref:FAS1 domain-containing protein n=1 Tax=Didymella exigua CBS 183.55 TaxID=1150837 RepID=A0A6A5S3H0_9PLEO|nr:uncharacterized protein M421DRAFT_1717 [Didymella exigua CBS 183.55]KAF1932037.1 hypothetical protein M421DRAFT_1717 [Didymella exigua CBS 183.55]
MKPTAILSLSLAAITTTAAASNVHAAADLIVRAIDPVTMDPTKFSVLSVLKTAMPTPTGTATDIVLPTGDVTPQWYKDLPADVMVLLAQMYPTTPTAAVSETAALAMNDSSSSIQDPTASQTTLTRTLEIASATLSATAYGTGSSNSSGVASAGSLFSNTTRITGGPTATVNGTMVPTGKPGLALSGKSVGIKNTIGTGVLSAVMGLSVAAAFCLFA